MQTTEKIPRGIELIAHGISGHGSVPLEVERDRASRGGGRASRRVAAADPLQRDDRRLFPRLAAISPPDARRLPRRPVHRPEGCAPPPTTGLFEHEPQHCVDAAHVGVAEHLHRRLPLNVIPSEAKATLDVRMLPDEDPAQFLEQVKQRRQRPGGRGRASRAQNIRPPGADGAARLRAVQGDRGRRRRALQRRRRCRR